MPNLLSIHLRVPALLAVALWALPVAAVQSSAPAAAPVPSLLAAAPTTSAADEAVVATGPAGDVSSAELEAGVIARVPAAERARFWVTRDAVQRLARNLAVQRALAAAGEQAGLAQDPEVAIALRLAREDILMQAYVRHRAGSVVPDEAALERWARSEYQADPKRFVVPEQLRVRHILLPVAANGSDEAEVKARAEQLLAELRQGADFAALAQANSSDKRSAQRGGELDWFASGQMVAQFERAAFALAAPGDLSEPVKTQHGWHIIRLEERKPSRMPGFDEVLPALLEEGRNRMQGDERRRLWDEVVDQVQIDDDALKAVMGHHLTLVKP